MQDHTILTRYSRSNRAEEVYLLSNCMYFVFSAENCLKYATIPQHITKEYGTRQMMSLANEYGQWKWSAADGCTLLNPLKNRTWSTAHMEYEDKDATAAFKQHVAKHMEDIACCSANEG